MIELRKPITTTMGADMSDRRIYQVLADAFATEGVDTIFVLTGDGNMHWEAAFSQLDASRSFHVRHEHCACAMASAYAVATGGIGVASVTCGPGLTQIFTALVTAARASIPLVVFSGESPLHSAWYNQHLDQARLVQAADIRYVAVHSEKQLLNKVQDAFCYARRENQPVVIGVPLDLQQQLFSAGSPYVPSTQVMPAAGRVMPDPDSLAEAMDAIRQARRIVVLGGRGAKASHAREACMALADACGGLLAHTLPVRGLFDDHPASIGVAGGFAHAFARRKFAEADLVIAIGASLTHHTLDAGRLFPKARIIQIDVDPRGVNQGLRTATLHIRGDAGATAEMLCERLGREGGPEIAQGWRTDDIPAQMAEPADPTPQVASDGLLHPADVVAALDRTLPKDMEIVNSSGHCSYFAAQMHGRSADNFLAIREFGAIGNGLSYAVGVAAAKPGRPVALVDGDGSFLMHVQELETVRRYGLKILFCILNDGAFGSEIHKLRADGLSDHGAMFGREGLADIARGFGLDAEAITDLSVLPAMLERFHASPNSAVWDFHISDRIISPVMRRLIA